VARSQTWLRLGEFEKAVSDCDQALALKSDLFSAWMAKGMALSEQGRPDLALKCFDRSVELRPLAALPMINRGETRRQIGVSILRERDSNRTKEANSHLREAVREFTTVVERHPHVARAYLLRGQTRATLGQADAAVDDLRHGIELGGEDELVVSCHCEIGRVRYASGNFDAAIWSFNRALEIDPNNPETLLLQSETLRRLGQDPEQVVSLSRYLDVGQPLSEVFWERGAARYRLRQLREAMQDFTRALDSDKSAYRPQALNRRGWMYLLHAHRFAEQDFDEAIRDQPANPDNYNGRGFARVLRGDYRSAVADAENAIELIRPEEAKLGVAVWALYFNAATIYGQAVDRVENDSELSDAERTKLREAYTSRAIALLDSARESADSKLHGRIAQAIQQEASFEPIRDTEGFREMVKRHSTP